MRKKKPLVIFGAGDQGRLNWEIAELSGYDVVGCIDEIKTETVLPGQFYRSIDDFVGDFRNCEVGFSIAIAAPYGKQRMEKHRTLEKHGFAPVNLIHPTAYISQHAKIGSGVQIMANATVGPWADIGDSVIINANSSVDHDCILEEGSEIAPGATLAGRIRVKKNAWICSGATVGPRITIGEGAIIGAGSVVLKDIPDATRAWGIPAKSANSG